MIGTTFGTGDGSSTFNVPDLRDKVPLGKGSNNDTLELPLVLLLPRLLLTLQLKQELQLPPQLQMQPLLALVTQATLPQQFQDNC